MGYQVQVSFTEDELRDILRALTLQGVKPGDVLLAERIELAIEYVEYQRRLAEIEQKLKRV